MTITVTTTGPMLAMHYSGVGRFVDFAVKLYVTAKGEKGDVSKRDLENFFIEARRENQGRRWVGGKGVRCQVLGGVRLLSQMKLFFWILPYIGGYLIPVTLFISLTDGDAFSLSGFEYDSDCIE